MDVLKIDLHLHTSEDPSDSICHDAVQLVDRAERLGFDALAITLHDRQLDDPALTRYARDRGIVLIPGIERTVQGRHVLLLNFPAAAEHVSTFDDIASLKARTGGLVIAPHAYFPERTCLGSLTDVHAELLDAIEWSYFWTYGVNFNRRAAQWARRHGKALVGNSDLHDLGQLGRTYSLVEADREPDAICAAIRDGRVSLHTSPVPPLELVRVTSGMVLRGRKRHPSAYRPIGLSAYRRFVRPSA